MVLVCVVVGLLIFFFLFFHASVVTAAGPVVRATRAAVEVLVGCSLTVSEDMLCGREGWGGPHLLGVFIHCRSTCFDTRWQVWGCVILAHVFRGG